MTEKYLKTKLENACLCHLLFFRILWANSFLFPTGTTTTWKVSECVTSQGFIILILCLSECVNNIYILKNPKYFSPGQNIRSIKDLSLTIWALILALDLPWWWFDDFIIRACNKVKLVVEEVTETKYPLL